MPIIILPLGLLRVGRTLLTVVLVPGVTIEGLRTITEDFVSSRVCLSNFKVP